MHTGNMHHHHAQQMAGQQGVTLHTRAACSRLLVSICGCRSTLVQLGGMLTRTTTQGDTPGSTGHCNVNRYQVPCQRSSPPHAAHALYCCGMCRRSLLWPPVPCLPTASCIAQSHLDQRWSTQPWVTPYLTNTMHMRCPQTHIEDTRWIPTHGSPCYCPGAVWKLL